MRVWIAVDVKLYERIRRGFRITTAKKEDVINIMSLPNSTATLALPTASRSSLPPIAVSAGEEEVEFGDLECRLCFDLVVRAHRVKHALRQHCEQPIATACTGGPVCKHCSDRLLEFSAPKCPSCSQPIDGSLEGEKPLFCVLLCRCIKPGVIILSVSPCMPMWHLHPSIPHPYPYSPLPPPLCKLCSSPCLLRRS